MNSAKFRIVCVISGRSGTISACSKLWISSFCNDSLSSVQQETNAALKRSRGNCEYVCARAQQDLKPIYGSLTIYEININSIFVNETEDMQFPRFPHNSDLVS
jgi:hypothetical protein